MNVKSLVKRSLTGGLLVAVMLVCIYLGVSFTLGFFFIALNFGLSEWWNLSRKLVSRPSEWSLYIWGNLVYFCSFFGFSSLGNQAAWLQPVHYLMICISVMAFMLATSIFSKRGIGSILMSLMAGLYLGIPFSLIVLLNQDSFGGGPDLLTGFFVLIWLGDVFAYLVGSLLGKHKLYPSLSPSKTWEGAIGGFIFTILGGWLWWKFMLPDVDMFHWLMVSVLVSIFGMLGDLFESKIKREAGVKDSGRILPGHGGILDRFDSAIMAAPIVFGLLCFLL